MARIAAYRSPSRPFSVRRVVAINSPQRTEHPAGAGISIRPFARSQRRLRHHCEVNVSGLHLRFPVENLRESVRFRALPLRSVSRPIRGDVNARHPFSAPISNTPDSSPVSAPLRVFFRNPPDQSVQPAPNTGSPPCQALDCPYAPRRFLFRFRFGSTLQTRFAQLDYRSTVTMLG